MSQLGTSWMFLIRVNCKIAIATVELVLRVIVFHVITYFAMLYMNYPRCGHCAFLANFISECTLMLVPLLEKVLHKESVVVEEIKEVKLRSRRVQFVYDRNYNRIGLQPQGHAPSRLPVKKLRRLLLKRRKVGYLYGRVSGKRSFLTIPPHSQLIPQPRRRSTRSHIVLLDMRWL